VVDYWPADTVFVSVVDPGVGTARKSIVVRLKSGQLVVTPDNGTLTLVAQRIGVTAVREIDEHRHRLPGSEGSYTFHGRDVYAYVAALLASGQLPFDDVGPLQTGYVELPHEQAMQSDGRVSGGIPVLDPQYGNVWTNIPAALLDTLHVHVGDRLRLTIWEGGVQRAALTLVYAHTFGDVPVGDPLLYLNSLGMVAVALNQKNFAATYGIASGPAWRVELTAERGAAR
jgi:S-adenosylmethionine hydrolase